ncbi:4'-phosphopantetheinyl transferase family protein [Streptomyces sp. NPDC056224]|uniref:4'-phosphopantetheinyl transferase family protein n=1 Tax=Streptomyces sp. NPDC056224 TaxID=3345750 RepID=UPI0035E31FE6
MDPTRPGPEPFDAPLHVPGPEGSWDEVSDRLDDVGRTLVCTTWGQWLTPLLLDPALRSMLGDDWPRYRQTPAAAGRMRFAASRFVMKYAAAAALNVPAHTLDLGYRPGGRPVLRGLGEDVDVDLDVSLAHTDELIVVGVSRTGPIGVDAEPVDRDVSFELLRGRVCTAEEDDVLAALPEGERRARLLRLWTLKEAYTKAHGHGRRRRFSTFGFGEDSRGRVVLADAPDEGAEAGEWSFATHLVQDRYLVSAAHRRRPAGPGARGVAVDTGSRSAAGPLEERGPRPQGQLRFLRPVTSGRGEGRRTP